jgi:hypothetical protein
LIVHLFIFVGTLVKKYRHRVSFIEKSQNMIGPCTRPSFKHSREENQLEIHDVTERQW